MHYMKTTLYLYGLEACPICIKVGKGPRGKKKPCVVVESVDPFELISTNVCKLKHKGWGWTCRQQTFKRRAEEVSVMNTEEMRLVEWEEREPGEGRKRTRADELCHTRQGRSSKKQQGSVTWQMVQCPLEWTRLRLATSMESRQRMPNCYRLRSE